MKYSLLSQQFNWLQKHGMRIKGERVVFWVGKNPNQTEKKHRVGFSISRKQAPSHMRSRLKRLFRERVLQLPSQEALLVHVLFRGQAAALPSTAYTLRWAQMECERIQGCLPLPS